MTDRDSSLKHISPTLARRPNKCIALSWTNLSNTGNSPRDSNIPIIKLTPGFHVGSLYEGPAPAVDRGERGRVYEGRGGLDSAACKFFKISCLYKHNHTVSRSIWDFKFL